MDHQAKKVGETLGTSQMKDLHQILEHALSRQWIFIDDRYWREKSCIKSAMKGLNQLNTLIDREALQTKGYQEKFETLMGHIRELGLYDVVLEKTLHAFGPEAAYLWEGGMDALPAWIGTMQHGDL